MPSYLCFKKFDDAHLLTDLNTDLERFVANHHTVDEDFVALHLIVMKHLDKRRSVKCNGFPEWYTSNVVQTRIQRHKRLRNKVTYLIGDTKRNFTVSVEKQNYSKAL